MKLTNINPYIRYVNNYSPTYSYTEKERIIYDYEFMYIFSGSALINYDDKRYLLKQGDLFYIKPGIKNNIIVDSDKKLRMHCIHFDWFQPEEKFDFTVEEFYMHSILSYNHLEKEALLRTRPNFEPEDFMIPTYSNGLLYDKFALLFSQCYYAFTSNSYTSELKTKAIFLEIITELFQAISGTALATVIHPKITYAIEYIKENYSNHITVAELSEKYGLSPKYFGKLFRLSTGKSINTFILDLRIYAAKEMLIGTNMTIEEISIKTGFYDAFYFSKCFKNKERLSPSQYRALMLKS